MAVTGTVVEYVVVIYHPRRGEIERRCHTVEDVDAVIEWSDRSSRRSNPIGLEFFTLIAGPERLERELGFLRHSPPGSLMYRTSRCPGCGVYAWWPKPPSGNFAHVGCDMHEHWEDYV